MPKTKSASASPASAKPKRNFTVQGSDIGFTGGHYESKSPSGAGSKAGTKLFKMIEHGVLYNSDKTKYKKYEKMAPYAKYAGAKSVKFLLRETTQDSAKKSFYYEVKQTTLKTPIIINRNGVDVAITRKMTIKACKDSHNHA
jgi:hypothetical protein